jgi:lipoic acid synthetase
MADLRAADVAILTLGQYLRPSAKHLPVARFYHPDEFAELAERGREMGFAHVESGPLVRSSYHAKRQTDQVQPQARRADNLFGEVQPQARRADK